MRSTHLRPALLGMTLLSAGLLPQAGQAGIVNGDFATGDFTGWTTDTDGSGLPTPLAPDFQVIGPQARIEADYWSTPGDTGSTALDQVQFANTLLQGLNLTVAPGSQLVLSFDWVFATDNSGAPSPPDENVQIGLVNGGNFYNAAGGLGFLLTATNYGSGSFYAVLGSSFNNASGFTLDFQLNAGFDGYGSHLLIDNVVFAQQAVPLPSTALLLAPALGLLGLRRRARA
jgi:hypothetical protein